MAPSTLVTKFSARGPAVTGERTLQRWTLAPRCVFRQGKATWWYFPSWSGFTRPVGSRGWHLRVLKDTQRIQGGPVHVLPATRSPRPAKDIQDVRGPLFMVHHCDRTLSGSDPDSRLCNVCISGVMVKEFSNRRSENPGKMVRARFCPLARMEDTPSLNCLQKFFAGRKGEVARLGVPPTP